MIIFPRPDVLAIFVLTFLGLTFGRPSSGANLELVLLEAGMLELLLYLFPNHAVVLGPRFEKTAPRVSLTPPPPPPPITVIIIITTIIIAIVVRSHFGSSQ